MKLREVSKRLRFPMFGNYRIVIVITNSLELSRNKRFCPETIEDDVQGLHTEDKETGTSYVFLKESSRASFVVHECWHAVKSLLDFIEANVEEEVVAYLLGYVVEHAVLLEITRKKK